MGFTYSSGAIPPEQLGIGSFFKDFALSARFANHTSNVFSTFLLVQLRTPPLFPLPLVANPERESEGEKRSARDKNLFFKVPTKENRKKKPSQLIVFAGIRAQAPRGLFFTIANYRTSGKSGRNRFHLVSTFQSPPRLVI